MDLQSFKPDLLRAAQLDGPKKIVVAMSGGVDSSVVAALMREAGHEVIGITLQLYDHGIAVNKKGACCAGIDIYDAQMAAASINIPHYVFNYESTFSAEVIQPFVASYIRGETPVPCILCNQKIKFRDLLRATQELDAAYLATGHYIRRTRDNSSGRFDLCMAADHSKDQSYFLFTTTQNQIDRSLFPLGDLCSKSQTRALAASYGLEIADKPDSQDICFVPQGDYREIVRKIHPESQQPGPIKTSAGDVVGTHHGIINYTVGQRRGLQIPNQEPLYVLKIIPETNEVIVGPRSQLIGHAALLRDVNWLGNSDWQEEHCTVKMRSSHIGSPATITNLGANQVRVELHEEYWAITPGQACVFYSGERLLGGGWIVSRL